jgi:hypothetical protein
MKAYKNNRSRLTESNIDLRRRQPSRYAELRAQKFSSPKILWNVRRAPGTRSELRADSKTQRKQRRMLRTLG